MNILHCLDVSHRGGIQANLLRLHRHSKHVHDFWAADGSMAEQMRLEGMRLFPGGPPEELKSTYKVVVGHTVGGWSYADNARLAHEWGAKFVECMHSIAASPTPPELVDGFVAMSHLASERNLRMPNRTTIYAIVERMERDPEVTPTVIGKLSRLADEKCPLEFIALAWVFAAQPFALAGDGPLLEVCQKRAPSNCLITGWVNPKIFYRNLKLFVFPTRDECCCTSVAQAQMGRVPVICQDIPALRETTGGFAHFARNSEEFVNHIHAFLRDPAPYLEMVDPAYNWTLTHFDPGITVRRWDSYLESIADGHD